MPKLEVCLRGHDVSDVTIMDHEVGYEIFNGDIEMLSRHNPEFYKELMSSKVKSFGVCGYGSRLFASVIMEDSGS